MKGIIKYGVMVVSLLWMACVIAPAAGAAVIGEVEANDSTGAAQNIDAYFSLDYDANIGDSTGADTSLTIPHVTIQGTGNGSFDYYSFTVGTDNSRVILDIDFGAVGGSASPGWADTVLVLYHADGYEILSNDNYSHTAGAGGSDNDVDAFIQHTLSAGLYFIGVGETPFPDDHLMDVLKAGVTYTLQVSIGNQALQNPSVP